MSAAPDYTVPAELYSGGKYKSSIVRYRKFPSAAEAIRFAIEQVPAGDLPGLAIEFDDDRYEGEAIRTLYQAPDYPFARKAR
jgi:hypothetical protein